MIMYRLGAGASLMEHRVVRSQWILFMNEGHEWHDGKHQWHVECRKDMLDPVLTFADCSRVLDSTV